MVAQQCVLNATELHTVLFFNKIFCFVLLICFWPRWIFIAVCRLSLVAASRDYSPLWCAGFSFQWVLLLWSTGFRRMGFSSCSTWALEHTGFSSCGAWAQLLQHTGSSVHRPQQLWCTGSVVVARGPQSTDSVVVAHGLSCSVACGIFPDQGSNPCPLHQQADP